MTTRHVITRVKEHFEKNGVMRKHMEACGVILDPYQSFEVLDHTNRGVVHLGILEALHIREVKPTINTKDEYVGRTLRIRI